MTSAYKSEWIQFSTQTASGLFIEIGLFFLHSCEAVPDDLSAIQSGWFPVSDGVNKT